MPPPQRARILLLIPHLGGGGAEHVIATLTRSLNSQKYEIHLAQITPSKLHCSPLPDHVTIHDLNASRVRRSSIKLLRLIWRLRPRLILSGMAHLNLLLLILRPFLPRHTRIMVRQNGALAATLASHSRLQLSRKPYSIAYRRADRVICQTEAMAFELHHELAVPRENLLVLPNPTDLHHIRASGALPHAGSSRAILLAIGRLVPEKGFDLLLEAFAALPAPLHTSELVIAGTGPQLFALQQQAQALGVHERVRFAGHVPDPILQFSHASLFVLSSRTEGLPNALLEAAASGLPIVSTPASAGITTLLRNRHGVWISTEISANTLRISLEQALVATQPGQRHAHHWIEPFDLTHAIPAYEAAIDGAIVGSGA